VRQLATMQHDLYYLITNSYNCVRMWSVWNQHDVESDKRMSDQITGTIKSSVFNCTSSSMLRTVSNANCTARPLVVLRSVLSASLHPKIGNWVE